MYVYMRARSKTPSLVGTNRAGLLDCLGRGRLAASKPGYNRGEHLYGGHEDVHVGDAVALSRVLNPLDVAVIGAES